jgi:hypothetical protein
MLAYMHGSVLLIEGRPFLQAWKTRHAHVGAWGGTQCARIAHFVHNKLLYLVVVPAVWSVHLGFLPEGSDHI